MQELFRNLDLDLSKNEEKVIIFSHLFAYIKKMLYLCYQNVVDFV